MILGAGIIFGPRIWSGIRDRLSPAAPPVTVHATADKGEPCGPSFTGPATYLFEQALVEVSIDNPSKEDVFLRRIRLVPGWLTGGFYAGDIPPAKGYDVVLDEWMGLLVIALGHSDQREAGQAALVEKGYAKKQETTAAPTWWVKPDPVEVKGLPARRYTVRRESQERFRFRLGLRDPSNVIEGPVHLEIEPEVGPPVKSDWFNIAVCTPGGHAKRP
ncbi:MAG: hypothetical protein ACT4OQ_00995 [Chloroflexota bacterium]